MKSNHRVRNNNDLAIQETKYFFTNFVTKKYITQFLMVSWNLSSGFLSLFAKKN